MNAAADALRVLAAHGLPGAAGHSVRAGSLDQLLVLADTQRVLPHVHRAVTAGRVVDATPRWATELRERTIVAAETTLAAHGATIELQRQLAALGIEDAIVLKGCATAFLDHAAPTDRFSSDVDVLVRRSSYNSVLDAFADRVRPVERGASWAREFGHATTLGSADRVPIDVHVRLMPGYIGMSMPEDAPHDDTVGYAIGGQALRALDGPGRLLHAALHARSAVVSMNSARDVPQLVLASGVDWETAIARATAWRVDHFFALGVASTWRRFDLPSHPLLDWATGHRAVGRQRIARFVAGSRPRGNVLAGPLAIPPRRWPAYVRPLLFPPREYVAAHDRGWRRRYRILRDELGRTSTG